MAKDLYILSNGAQILGSVETEEDLIAKILCTRRGQNR